MSSIRWGRGRVRCDTMSRASWSRLLSWCYYIFHFVALFEHCPSDNSYILSEKTIKSLQCFWGSVEMHCPVAGLTWLSVNHMQKESMAREKSWWWYALSDVKTRFMSSHTLWQRLSAPWVDFAHNSAIIQNVHSGLSHQLFQGCLGTHMSVNAIQ